METPDSGYREIHPKWHLLSSGNLEKVEPKIAELLRFPGAVFSPDIFRTTDIDGDKFSLLLEELGNVDIPENITYHGRSEDHYSKDALAFCDSPLGFILFYDTIPLCIMGFSIHGNTLYVEQLQGIPTHEAAKSGKNHNDFLKKLHWKKGSVEILEEFARIIGLEFVSILPAKRNAYYSNHNAQRFRAIYDELASELGYTVWFPRPKSPIYIKYLGETGSDDSAIFSRSTEKPSSDDDDESEIFTVLLNDIQKGILDKFLSTKNIILKTPKKIAQLLKK